MLFICHVLVGIGRLLGEDRSIVSDVAGTTRDTVDAILQRGNITYRFVLIDYWIFCIYKYQFYKFKFSKMINVLESSRF